MAPSNQDKLNRDILNNQQARRREVVVRGAKVGFPVHLAWWVPCLWDGEDVLADPCRLVPSVALNATSNPHLALTPPVWR